MLLMRAFMLPFNAMPPHHSGKVFFLQLARQILDEYYHGFQERNPNLFVFSAHIHMDEATPHLHIS